VSENAAGLTVQNNEEDNIARADVVVCWNCAVRSQLSVVWLGSDCVHWWL